MFGGNLPRSFPTIDRFENGLATSIKSIDLSAPTYQSSTALTSRLTGYVDKVAGFNGATFDGVAVRSSDIAARGLDIAIPPGPVSAAQQAVLDQIVSYGATKGVAVRVVPVG